jgi:hypothetical protein
MLADASGIDCAFCLGQNKIFSLSLNQGNLDILLVALPEYQKITHYEMHICLFNGLIAPRLLSSSGQWCP